MTTDAPPDVKNPPHPVRDVLTRALFDGASLAGRRAHALVCALYFGYKHRAPDPWAYTSSPYEQRKYARTMALVAGRSYGRALELGCSEGVFTRALGEAGDARAVLGVDISRAAVRRARARCRDLPHVRFEQGDAFRTQPPGPFDLVVCAEVLYYAGVRAPAVARGLAAALAPGGRLVLVHEWPRARALHAPFAALPELVPLTDAVDEDPVRPYALASFERRR